MTGWELLPRIVLLLAAAAAAGLLLRGLRQSVIVGYLLAGVLLGPTGLGLVATTEDVQLLSELGVALLLFAIGLEFSFARLRALGSAAAGAGPLQLGSTTLAGMAAARAVGVDWQPAVLLGMAFSMSSTAVVLRALTDRAELDSTHGRSAIGILLFQDLAVIPVLIATDAMPRGAGAAGLAAEFVVRLSLVLVFLGAAWAIARLALPRLFTAAVLSGSRELPVLIAVCTSIGAAWAAHSFGFSATLGAFLAGLVLAESPFATQIRADLTPLSAVFTTLFFASIGTAVRLPLEGGYLLSLAAAAAGVMIVKTALASASLWFWQRSFRTALIAGICVSQVGEFTFVIAENGYRSGLITAEAFQFTLGISLLTLVATPYAIGGAPWFSAIAMRRLAPRQRLALETERPAKLWRRVIVIGFGPAGQQVVRRLVERDIPMLVLDMNPNTVAEHRSRISIELGDATQREVLQHFGVGQCLSVIITIPDPATARLICAAAQALAPGVPIVARSRYHQYTEALREAGADRVVDEEFYVGLRLADEALESLSRAVPAVDG